MNFIERFREKHLLFYDMEKVAKNIGAVDQSFAFATLFSFALFKVLKFKKTEKFV